MRLSLQRQAPAVAFCGDASGLNNVSPCIPAEEWFCCKHRLRETMENGKDKANNKTDLTEQISKK